MEVSADNYTVTPQRQKISKQLYIFAWAIEIFAVLIGLAIALMQGITSFSESMSNKGTVGFAGISNITIAVLPFIMVAIVELTKIPFVQAFYHSTLWRWKLIFGISLCFIAFITFESALNGFERNFSGMMYGIDKNKKELISLEESMLPLEEQRTRLESLTAEQIETDYSNRLKQISAERDEASRLINQRIADIRGSVQSEVTKSLEQSIADKRKEAEQLRSELASEIARMSKELETSLSSISGDLRVQRENLNRQLNDETSSLRELKQQVNKEIDDANFLTRGKVKEDGERRISEKENLISEIRQQLNSLTIVNKEQAMTNNYQNNVAKIRNDFNQRLADIDGEIRTLTGELQRSLGQRQSDVSGQLNALQRELNSLNETFIQQQKENEARRNEDLSLLSDNNARIAAITAQLEDKKIKRLAVRDVINQKVGDNQIYRMAQWFFDKESAADLDRSQVAVIAMIWFGSLAALIAFTGIILALASCAINDPKNAGDKRAHRNSLSLLLMSLRRYFVSKRRRYKEPIIHEVPRDVVKEVPVDRVVKVEVPVEVVKREIVHVPFYTNDKSLIEITEGHDKFFRFKGATTNGQ